MIGAGFGCRCDFSQTRLRAESSIESGTGRVAGAPTSIGVSFPNDQRTANGGCAIGWAPYGGSSEVWSLQRLQRLVHSSRATQSSERVRDRQRAVAQLTQSRLEGRPLLIGGFLSIRGLRGEA